MRAARNASRCSISKGFVARITCHLLEAADYEAEGERGQEFENHLHCLDLPIL
jgi:hypothetical protein